jgi:hypothetical protein
MFATVYLCVYAYADVILHVYHSVCHVHIQDPESKSCVRMRDF